MENMSVSLSHIVHSSSSICSSQSDSVTYPPEMRPLQPSGTRGDTAETTITSTVGITDPSQTTSLSRSNADYNQIELDQGDRSLSVGEQVSLSGLVEDNVAMREQTVSKRNPSEITATESSRSGKQLDDIVENARSKSHFGEPGQSSLKVLFQRQRKCASCGCLALGSCPRFRLISLPRHHPNHMMHPHIPYLLRNFNL